MGVEASHSIGRSSTESLCSSPEAASTSNPAAAWQHTTEQNKNTAVPAAGPDRLTADLAGFLASRTDYNGNVSHKRFLPHPQLRRSSAPAPKF